MILAGDAGLVVGANALAEELFGLSRHELLGRPIEDLFSRPWLRLRRTGARLELPAVRSDGSEFPAEISLSRIETPDGELVAAAIRDSSESAVREASLREARERFRRVFEDGPVAMAMVGDDFKLAEVNDAFCRLTGYSAARARGADLRRHHPPRRRRHQPAARGQGVRRRAALVQRRQALPEEERRGGLGRAHRVRDPRRARPPAEGHRDRPGRDRAARGARRRPRRARPPRARPRPDPRVRRRGHLSRRRARPHHLREPGGERAARLGPGGADRQARSRAAPPHALRRRRRPLLAPRRDELPRPLPERAGTRARRGRARWWCSRTRASAS